MEIYGWVLMRLKERTMLFVLQNQHPAVWIFTPRGYPTEGCCVDGYLAWVFILYISNHIFWQYRGVRYRVWWYPKFKRYWYFFSVTKYFWYRYWYFFLVPNFCDTGSDTFFPVPNLSDTTKNLRNSRYRYLSGNGTHHKSSKS